MSSYKTLAKSKKIKLQSKVYDLTPSPMMVIPIGTF